MPSSSALNSELQFDDVRHGFFVFVFWPKKKMAMTIAVCMQQGVSCPRRITVVNLPS
jgi:hypothetical protein